MKVDIVVALSLLFLLPTLFYLTRRVLHYRKIRKLSSSIARAVISRGANDGLTLTAIAESAAMVFGVPREVIRVSRENHNWIVILFTGPTNADPIRLLYLTEQTRAFLPTWANFKLLTTNEEPRSGESASDRRKERMRRAVESLEKAEKGRGDGVGSQGLES
jgi:hypothetical protein